MILYCDACGVQNFVSDERRAVAAVPPRCWKCGANLPNGVETGREVRESNRRIGEEHEPGDSEDA